MKDLIPPGQFLDPEPLTRLCSQVHSANQLYPFRGKPRGIHLAFPALIQAKGRTGGESRGMIPTFA
ncbi:MAG: hypothetical protein DRP70_04060 [Spirochaetes bacterium]|nr:MAG: hypothetical protein DRP70_04060 [Spirochaetota bacterium]